MTFFVAVFYLIENSLGNRANTLILRHDTKHRTAQNEADWSELVRMGKVYPYFQVILFAVPQMITWVYSFKLWNLQRQLVNIVKGQTKELSNVVLWLIFLAGTSIICVASGLLAADLWKHKANEKWRVMVFVSSILTSLMSVIFTLLSFKWMRELQDQTICIPWSNIILHSSAFLMYAIALVLFFSLTLTSAHSLTKEEFLNYDFETFFARTRRITIVYEFYLVLSFASLSVLLYIFDLLLRKQGKYQSQFYDRTDDKRNLSFATSIQDETESLEEDF